MLYGQNAEGQFIAAVRTYNMLVDEGRRVAALLIAVTPGAYTVEVKGKDAAEGIALLEIYEVP